MTDGYDPQAWILEAAQAGKLIRYDHEPPVSWSANGEYLSVDETRLAERLLADGVIRLGQFDSFGSAKWFVNLDVGKLAELLAAAEWVCACVTDEQADGLVEGFSRPVCAVHPTREGK